MPADRSKAFSPFTTAIVAPVVVGVILLIAGGVVGGIFGRDDEHAPPPSAAPPPPVAPSPSPPPVAPSSSLTAGEFAQRANEICVDTSPRIGQIMKPIRDLIPLAADGDEKAERAIQQRIEWFKRVLRKRQQRLKALGTPQGEAQETAADFVRADSSIQDGVLADLGDVQDALKEGDRGALVNRFRRLTQTYVANGREGTHRDALALELGAEQCAR